MKYVCKISLAKCVHTTNTKVPLQVSTPHYKHNSASAGNQATPQTQKCPCR